MATTAPARVGYAEQQVLRAGDLADEQRYRVAARRRHNRELHGPGIVSGLELVLADDGTLRLRPGCALDALGRELIVAAAQEFHAADLDAALAQQDEVGHERALDLWLVYAEEEAPPAADGTRRLVETTRVTFSTVGQEPPLDGASGGLAPVFLGTLLQWVSEKMLRRAVDLSERVYAPLWGERVVAVTRLARVLLGPEEEPDSRRFAVGTRAAAGTDYDDVLAVDTAGNARLAGPVVITPTPPAPATARDGGKIPPALVVARRAYELTPCDMLRPGALLKRLRDGDSPLTTHLDARARHWDAAAWRRLTRTSGDPTPAGAALLRQFLNFVIDREATLYDPQHPERFAAVPLRPETRRLIDPANTRPEPRRRNRLLLEDAFPTVLGRLPDEPDAPHGVVLAEGVPPPKAAWPWQVYRASVPNKDTGQTDEQLRIEIFHPGKKGDPARYRLAVGLPGEDVGAAPGFQAALTVAADGTVTVANNLKVAGQLIKAAPADGLNTASSSADLLAGAAGSQGLTVKVTYAVVNGPPYVLALSAVVSNGRSSGTITGVTVLANVTVTPAPPLPGATQAVPSASSVVLQQGLAIPAGGAVPVTSSAFQLLSGGQPLAAKPAQVQVTVLAQGVSPSGSLASNVDTLIATLP
jgi:hypothetical protein